MTDWRFQSQGMRRRYGAPNSHMEGAAVSKNSTYGGDPMADALAGMAQVGNPRVPMGTAAVALAQNLSADPGKGMLRPRYSGIQPGDPALTPGGHRAPIIQEALGARYGVNVSTPAFDASGMAQYTQASGRVIPSRVMRTSDNFASEAYGQG